MRISAWAVLAAAQAATAAYWMEEIAHQGIAAFNNDTSYEVFRNVKDFGAVGDGVTDDTDAINKAITTGDRCGGDSDCAGSTTTPATVYFPAGTYLVSDSIVPYYYTQLIGDPTSMPTLKASADFREDALGVIDANPYGANGLRFGATNTFFRQIRNLVLDTTDVPGVAYGLHWPSSQVTSLQNLVFKLSREYERGHIGIFVEEGSGGFMGDLVFMGGKICANFGNQQFTTRNLTFHGCENAINQLWDWGWTYKSINIYGGKLGINMSEAAVGSVSLVDAVIAGVETAILTGRNASQPIPGGGALTLENVVFKNVSHILVGIDGDIIAGSEDTVTQESYLFGNVYDPEGPLVLSEEDAKYNGRPKALLNSKGAYYERPKPQYEDTPSSLVLSARQFGAVGDGVTDDTRALNELFRAASAQFTGGVLAFLDAGFYLVTDTVYIPPNVRITGEALAAIILGSGPKFSDVSSPYPVVQVGKPGETGYVEWSDTIVSGKGATAGAVFIEYNLDTPTNSTSGNPSGLWDVHVRVGGFTGDDLGLDKCPTYPDKENFVDENCICGYLSMHITESAYNLYLENNWLWVADHVIDDVNATRVSLFAARGMHIASTKGRIWLYGTSVEHHTLYQYSLANTRDIFMGQIQTETPYYQPNPPAPLPFTDRDESLYDPDFDVDCATLSRRTNMTLGEADIQCRMAYGLQIHDSSSVRVVGAGIYSFFNNYQTNCSALDSGDWRCQKRIFSIGAASGQDTYTPPAGVSATTDVVIYGLNTVGTKNMVTKDGVDTADWRDNTAGFSAAIAQFRYD